MTTLSALSDRDVDFLNSMSVDEEDSRISDIAERLNITDSYAQNYKRRLIQAGVIEQTRRGCIGFSIPYLKQYLKERSGG